MDERTLQRWVALEAHRINQHVVSQGVPLWRLVRIVEARARGEATDSEPVPTATTRGGAPHEFDLDAVARFAAPLDRLTISGVELPIRLWITNKDPLDCYCQDPGAIEALVAGGHAHTSPRDGRLWMSVPLARRLAHDHPTLFQFVYY